MDALKAAIAKEGQNLGNGILKVDGIINHQIRTELILECAKNAHWLLSDVNVDRVLTAETSGIAFALALAWQFGVDMVYARKVRPITMNGEFYVQTAPSHTKGELVEFHVAREYMPPGENVLLVDDFLARGLTLVALREIVLGAGSQVSGISCLVEKTFEGGCEYLRSQGYRGPILSLARIASMSNGRIEFE